MKPVFVHFVFCAGLVLALSTPLFAQKRPRVPDFNAFDPTKFFDEFTGKHAEDRKRELAKINVSRKEEDQAGEQELDGFKQRLAARSIQLESRGQEVEYLTKLVLALQPQMKQAKRYSKLQVQFFEDDEPQAWSVPGGQLLISRGMLDKAGSEAALVCVLGHELAHLDRGHLLIRVKQLKLMQQRMNPAANGEFDFARMFQSFDAMQQLFRRPFGPEEELEADRDGITWAYQLAYDPLAIEGLYAALDKPGAEFLPAFLKSHPPSAERRENLAATVGRLTKGRKKADLYVGRENLKRLVPKSEREFKE